jgi:hypothetical protein
MAAMVAYTGRSMAQVGNPAAKDYSDLIMYGVPAAIACSEKNGEHSA